MKLLAFLSSNNSESARQNGPATSPTSDMRTTYAQISMQKLAISAGVCQKPWISMQMYRARVTAQHTFTAIQIPIKVLKLKLKSSQYSRLRKAQYLSLGQTNPSSRPMRSKQLSPWEQKFTITPQRMLRRIPTPKKQAVTMAMTQAVLTGPGGSELVKPGQVGWQAQQRFKSPQLLLMSVQSQLEQMVASQLSKLHFLKQEQKQTKLQAVWSQKQESQLKVQVVLLKTDPSITSAIEMMKQVFTQANSPIELPITSRLMKGGHRPCDRTLQLRRFTVMGFSIWNYSRWLILSDINNNKKYLTFATIHPHFCFILILHHRCDSRSTSSF